LKGNVALQWAIQYLNWYTIVNAQQMEQTSLSQSQNTGAQNAVDFTVLIASSTNYFFTSADLVVLLLPYEMSDIQQQICCIWSLL
jgi:hypothetical protein